MSEHPFSQDLDRYLQKWHSIRDYCYQILPPEQRVELLKVNAVFLTKLPNFSTPEALAILEHQLLSFDEKSSLNEIIITLNKFKHFLEEK